MLIDVGPQELTGRQAAGAMRESGITLNYNSLPYDKHGPMITSGLRIGTPAVTTLGMGEAEMDEIAGILKLVLEGTKGGLIPTGPNAGAPSKTRYEIDAAALKKVQARVKGLLDRFPVYPQLDLAFLQRHFQ
jgi:glycine hydroxymethyltransferase